MFRLQKIRLFMIIRRRVLQIRMDISNRKPLKYGMRLRLIIERTHRGRVIGVKKLAVRPFGDISIDNKTLLRRVYALSGNETVSKG